MPDNFRFWEIPPLFRQCDVFIVGGGPSVAHINPDLLSSRRVIAVNNAHELIPHADILYWGDERWFRWNKEKIAKFPGLKITRKATTLAEKYRDISVLRYRSMIPWSDDRDCVAGVDSGHQAINLAALAGARRIFLIGFDMKPDADGRCNYHDDHKREADPERMTKVFVPNHKKAAKEARKRGIKIYNCNPDSALDCYEKITFEKALRMTRTRKAVVTTCSEKQFREYGARMIDSITEYWPDVRLVVYAEDFPIASRPNLHVIDLARDCSGLTEFKERHQDNPSASGIVNGKYTYRHDAVKFAHKVFAYCEAVERYVDEIDHLFFLDADTVAHAPVDEDALEALIGKNAIGLLLRKHEYPETGFMIFDLRNPQTRLLLNYFRSLYETDGIFDYRETHDGFVMGEIVREYEAEDAITIANLSGAGYTTNHPLVNGPLGAWFDHLKGKWKNLGRSPRGTLRVRRSEKHWK